MAARISRTGRAGRSNAFRRCRRCDAARSRRQDRTRAAAPPCFRVGGGGPDLLDWTGAQPRPDSPRYGTDVSRPAPSTRWSALAGFARVPSGSSGAREARTPRGTARYLRPPPDRREDDRTRPMRLCTCGRCCAAKPTAYPIGASMVPRCTPAARCPCMAELSVCRRDCAAAPTVPESARGLRNCSSCHRNRGPAG